MYTILKGQLLGTTCPSNYENLLLQTGQMVTELYFHPTSSAYNAIRPGGIGLALANSQYNPHVEVALTQDGTDVTVEAVYITGGYPAVIHKTSFLLYIYWPLSNCLKCRKTW